MSHKHPSLMPKNDFWRTAQSSWSASILRHFQHGYTQVKTRQAIKCCKHADFLIINLQCPIHCKHAYVLCIKIHTKNGLAWVLPVINICIYNYIYIIYVYIIFIYIYTCIHNISIYVCIYSTSWYPYQTTQTDATLSMAETINQLNRTLSNIIPYFSNINHTMK